MRVRDRLGLTLTSLLIALAAGAEVSSDGPEPVRYAPGQVIVKLKAEAVAREAQRGASGKALPQVPRLAPEAVRDLLSDRVRPTGARPVFRRGRLESAGGPAAGRSAAARRDKFGLSRVFVLDLDEGEDVEATVRRLSADPDVEYAHPNYVAQTFFMPNDPYFQTSGSWGQPEPDLWGLKLMELESAWDITQGEDPQGNAVVVAVLDTGVDFSHPDLAANAWVNAGEDLDGDGELYDPDDLNGIDDDNNGYIDDVHGYDFVNSAPYPIDDYGHGTHVAGTIAAVGNNMMGIIGVAPKAKVMGLKGFYPGLIDNLAVAIEYAVDNGASVVNNSWGCPDPRIPVLEDAVRYAIDADVVLVFSAGNGSLLANLLSPQNMSETITVSATTPTDVGASFTNFGPLVDVGAPGAGATQPGSLLRNILSLLSADFPVPKMSQIVDEDGMYYRWAGTSMASPHVAGLAALLRAKDPTLSVEQIRQIMRLSADPLPTTPRYLGYGRVNALQALGSSVSAAILIRTPSPRGLKDVVALEGFASPTTLQGVEIFFGEGDEPVAFTPLGATWDSATGDVVAQMDASAYADGPALLKLRADDGVHVFESTTWVEIDNVRFTSHENRDVVSGTITIDFDIATAAQGFKLSIEDTQTGTTTTLLEQQAPTGTSFSVSLDTTDYRDSGPTPPFRGVTLILEVTKDLGNGPVVITETLDLLIENAEFTLPTRNGLFTSTSPLIVQGSSTLPYRIEVGQGGSWSTVLEGPGGEIDAFSLDPTDSGYGLDFEASNLVLLRILNDIDGDGAYEGDEANEFVRVLVDPTMLPGWPVRTTQGEKGPQVVVGDVDGDGADEAIDLGRFEFVVARPSERGFSDLVSAWRGDGTVLQALSHTAEFDRNLHGPASLVDLDGVPGLEVVYATLGRLWAFLADGQAPPGFNPETYNDGLFVLDRHLEDPDYRELHANESIIPFRDGSGSLRLVSGFRHFDTVRADSVDKSTVAVFDAGGALLNERDVGPGQASLQPDSSHDPILGDFDADGSLEIAVTRIVNTAGGTVEVRILDAATLVEEVVITRSAYDLPSRTDELRSLLSAADLDGDGDLELFLSGTETASGLSGILAFHHDGSDVAGFPHRFAGGEPRAIAAGDLDLDGDAELVVVLEDRIEALDYDAGSGSPGTLPGWPVLPEPLADGNAQVAIGNADSDPEPEVIFEARETVQGGSTVTIESPYVEIVNADGSPWRGGWRRYLRGDPSSIALGDLDGAGPTELVVAYSIVDDGSAAPEDPVLLGLGELVAYPLEDEHNAAAVPWGQYKGNAQHTGTVPDTDLDQVPDQTDNCLLVANGLALGSNSQCDADSDGFGNSCDADINNSGAANGGDVQPFLDALAAGDLVADINCSGAADAGDVNAFLNLLAIGEVPGPSGWSCAGQVPCP